MQEAFGVTVRASGSACCVMAPLVSEERDVKCASTKEKCEVARRERKQRMREGGESNFRATVKGFSHSLMLSY